MVKTPELFYETYVGKAIDFDRYAGVQCVDAFRVWGAWADVPVGPTPTNWAEGYWTHRYQLGYEKYFDFITNKNDVRNGDWCIWLKGSSCSLSHIAMYYNGQYFGERQNGNLFFCLANLQNDWAGALRWKGWHYGMKVGSWEKVIDQYAGIDIVVIGVPDGDKITIGCAKNESGEVTGRSVQKIQDIDDPYHIYDMKLNGGFFNNNPDEDTYGEPYGVRCGQDSWEVPRQGKFIYYAIMKDGRTEVGLDNNFWYTPDQCQCARSPAMVLMHNGVDVEYVSPHVNWRRTYACSQSMLIRTKDRFVFAVSKGNLTPDQCRAWAKSIDGVQDLVFNDAGGSTCEQYGYEVITGTGENRKISDAWMAYHDKAIFASEPQEGPSLASDVEDAVSPVPVEEAQEKPQDEAPVAVVELEHGSEVEEVNTEDKKTIPGQVAKLIDVKSLITLSLTLAFVRLALMGTIDEQQMMTIYTVIIGFYFGTQATKK